MASWKSCDFMAAFTLPEITNLPSFMVIGFAKEDMLHLYFFTSPHITTLRIIWLYRGIHQTVRPKTTLFGGHRPCKRGEIKFSICLVTSCDQRIIRHYGWVSLIINYHSAKLGGSRPCRRGDILFLICHVTSYDHVVTGWCDIMGKFSSL